AGALAYFHEDGIDTTHKDDMRDRILRGPPFTAVEREKILTYCAEDVHALVRLVPHLIPTVRSLPHAMARSEFMWATAQQERRGIPLDLSTLERLRSQWSGIQLELVAERNPAYGVYEIVDGRPHWRNNLFADYIKRNNMAWPALESGALDLRDIT